MNTPTEEWNEITNIICSILDEQPIHITWGNLCWRWPSLSNYDQNEGITAIWISLKNVSMLIVYRVSQSFRWRSDKAARRGRLNWELLLSELRQSEEELGKSVCLFPWSSLKQFSFPNINDGREGERWSSSWRARSGWWWGVWRSYRGVWVAIQVP